MSNLSGRISGGSTVRAFTMSPTKGTGIASMVQTVISHESEGVNTWTATLTDGSTYSFDVTNGEQGATGPTGPQGATGVGITSVAKTGTSGNVDTYTITFSDGSSTTFTVTNAGDAGTVAYDGSASYPAGSVGNEVTNLKTAITDDFENVEKSNTHGYFAQPTSVNVLEPTSYSASYTSPIVWDKCNSGDIYKVTITGLSGLYPYIICNNTGTVIKHGVVSRSLSDEIIVIPDGGAYFGANQYGTNDTVSKKTGLPKENAFKLNKVEKVIDITYNHSYIGTSSPVNIQNPATTSASYAGGWMFEQCNEGDVYVVSAQNTATSAYNIFICDSTGAIIAHSLIGRTGKELKNWFVVIPSGGAFIGVNVTSTDAFVIKYEPVTYAMLTKTDNPFSDLKGVAFGTSLTQRADGSGTYGYLTTLRSVLDCTIDNQGVGGSYWFLTDYTNRSVTYVVENYSNYADKDFVIIEGCVNDWFTSKVLGTYTDNAYTSVCGCLRKMIEHVYSQKPTAQIFVILDHQGQNSGGNDCSATAIVNGKTQYEYYSELKKVCQLYSVPVICEFEESSIGMFGTQYLADNIHCNALGAKQSGTYIANKMKEIGIKVKA